MSDKKTQQNPSDRPHLGDAGVLPGENSAARITREGGLFRPAPGTVDAQANSAIAAGIIGLGLANQIATDQGQSSVTANVQKDAQPQPEAATATYAPDPVPGPGHAANDASTGFAPSADQPFDAPIQDHPAQSATPTAADALPAGFAPPLGQPFHREELAAHSLDPSRPVAPPLPSGALLAPPRSAGQSGDVAGPAEKAAAIGIVTPPTTVQDGLASGVDDILSPILGPVLAPDGLVGNLVDNVVAPVLRPILRPGGVLDGLLGDDGVLAPVTDLLQPVLGPDGIVGDLVDGVVVPILNPILGPDGVLGSLLDDNGALAPVTASIAPVLTETLGSITAPLINGGGLLGGVVGQGGLLGGLLGAGDASEGAFPDEPKADFLDTLIGIEGPEDAVSALPSIMDFLLSDAPPEMTQITEAGEDVLASLLDLPDLTGRLAAETTAITGLAPDSDPQIDTLLNEILDSADRPLAGVADPVGALLDFGQTDMEGGIFADAVVEKALGVIFAEAGVSPGADGSGGSLADLLPDPVSPDDQP